MNVDGAIGDSVILPTELLSAYTGPTSFSTLVCREKIPVWCLLLAIEPLTS